MMYVCISDMYKATSDDMQGMDRLCCHDDDDDYSMHTSCGKMWIDQQVTYVGSLVGSG